MDKSLIIVGSVALLAITILAVQNVSADDSDLLDLIDLLEAENTELILENDSLHSRLTSASHKMVDEHFGKLDARKALEYLSQFTTEDQNSIAYELAKRDSASKFWEAREIRLAEKSQ